MYTKLFEAITDFLEINKGVSRRLHELYYTKRVGCWVIKFLTFVAYFPENLDFYNSDERLLILATFYSSIFNNYT